jgi:outer membrane receptor protein involved in Fe transport
VQATAQLRTSYQNAEGAKDKGIELEARKNIGQWFSGALNYTFVDSAIEVGRQTGQVQTSTVRPLAGQSEHIFNGVFELRVPDTGLSTRALYNYFGDRIVDVGSLGLPDILEEGRGRLDIVALYEWNQLVFRFSAENLNDPEYLFTQGGEVHRLFKSGRSFKFALGYTVF